MFEKYRQEIPKTNLQKWTLGMTAWSLTTIYLER
jgi:hypothetical protein